MVQKCLTPSTTQPPSTARTIVSIVKVRERLTAGSLPQLPNILPRSTTSAIVAALLRLRAEGVDEAHDRRVHVQRHGRAGAAAGDDADDADIGRHVEPHAPVARRAPRRRGSPRAGDPTSSRQGSCPRGRTWRRAARSSRASAHRRVRRGPAASGRALARHGRLGGGRVLPRRLLAAAGAGLVQLDQVAVRIVHEDLLELRADHATGCSST